MLEKMGVDTTDDEAVFQAMAEAMAAFEKTRVFNRFDSKFDFVEAGVIDYTAAEQRGADSSDQVCGTCHAAAGPVVNGVELSLLTDSGYRAIRRYRVRLIRVYWAILQQKKVQRTGKNWKGASKL